MAGGLAMISLRPALRDYVSMRRGLGYKFKKPAKRLEGFITFMEQSECSVITTNLALKWATRSPGKHASWAINLTDVRGFARHLQSIDPRTEVPPVGLLPYSGRARPYIYTDTEIQALLTASLELSPVTGLRRWTYHCLFGLLPVTGLRISEALALQQQDVDFESGTITVRDTKFGKSRLVPIHQSTRQVLIDYASRRDAHCGALCSQYFFVAERGGKLLSQQVYRVFLHLSRQIGFRDPAARSGPRLHDFRHNSETRIIPSCTRLFRDSLEYSRI